ncbi:hypothetical protein L228DRAFT_246322 [Xylona heveae TC161]|uniref:Uncharacterized protein n=1 Tax=Xylona heveae (strain CBS 132557 / TC161) TaxID=1328760 RepID=A0A165HHU9_XYLHT|nr:hypothetical protein L228DRAFT_246322 [Xylona heveae TC161]KZF23540.1 hypothetical protein L228DRAFT_246322 [Xylona heveae TC161]
MDPPPPPPPPHGANPRSTGSSGLPPGNYDIFIIPPHSSGSGFLYLPSLQPHRNSFLAGVFSTLLALGIWTIVAPVLREWFSRTVASGGAGVVVLLIAVGVAGWAWGKTQMEKVGGSARTSGNEGGPGASGPSPGASAPPPNAGPPPFNGPPPHSAGPSPGAGPGPGPGPSAGTGPRPGWQRQQGPTPGASEARQAWEKARQETKRKEEERKRREEAEKKAEAERKKKEEETRRQEEERRRKEDEERRRQDDERRRKEDEERRKEDERRKKEEEEMRREVERLREEAEKKAREAAEKEKWEKARKDEREARLKQARERREKETKEKEAKERETKEKEAREQAAREKEEKEAKEKEAKEAKEKADKEAREARLRELRERREKEKREKEAREAREKEKEKEAAWTAPSTYAASILSDRERTPYHVSSPSSSTIGKEPRTPSPKKQAAAKSEVGSEDAYSYRPYDKPKRPVYKQPSHSSFYSESSYAPSQSTARTTPPPSNRGPYFTKDPDKIMIQAVYLFSDTFPKQPLAELVSGIGSVTDGLILKITTEGLFIDDDVRHVPQREWDLKAWTMKLVEVWCPHFKKGPASASAAQRRAQNPMRTLFGDGKPPPPTSEETDLLIENLLRTCKSNCHIPGSDGPNGYSSSQTGDFKGVHVLRASIRDQEGKKYIFVIQQEEGWKVAIGLQRLRRGTQVRALGVSGMTVNETRALLNNIDWVM